jgi:flagellar protein FlbD
MIRLTRINGQELTVNAEQIKFIEETPDTVITLLNAEKLIVKERANDVVERVVAYLKDLRSGMRQEIWRIERL